MGVRARQTWITECDGPLTADGADAAGCTEAKRATHSHGAARSPMEAAAAAYLDGWRFPSHETARGREAKRELAVCPDHADPDDDA
jgi:hypothetical protein